MPSRAFIAWPIAMAEDNTTNVILMDALGDNKALVDASVGILSTGTLLDEMAGTVSDGVSVILVSSVSARQTSIFDSSALLILSYGTIFATGLVGNLLVILTLTRNQRGKVRSARYHQEYYYYSSYQWGSVFCFGPRRSRVSDSQRWIDRTDGDCLWPSRTELKANCSVFVCGDFRSSSSQWQSPQVLLRKAT